MMHIEYDDRMMSFYENYITTTFKQKVRDLRNSYVFDYKKEKDIQTDTSCVLFLDYLLKNDNLWELANTPAGKLEDKITEYQKRFPDFGLKKAERKKSTLYKCAYALFVDIGYAELDVAKLFDAIGTDVCPYCNRVFVRVVKTHKDYADIEKGKKAVRGGA